MKPTFEYSDTLNSPYEAFYFTATLDNFPIYPHWHYFVEIIYMLEGAAYVESGNDNYVLEPGDLIFIHPEMPHAIYSTGKLPLRYNVLKFNMGHLNLQNTALPKLSEMMQMIAEEPSLSVYFEKKEIAHIPMSDLFQTCIKIVTEKQFGYDVLAHSYYCIIVTELIKVWISKGFQLKKQPKKVKTSESLSNILEYIHVHANEELNVEELASMCNMSYSHFAKEFKQLYGQTCKDYILTTRLQKAEDLLKFTDYDLNYISQECGFCDCSHFIKYFRKKNHITPRQYRLQQ